MTEYPELKAALDDYLAAVEKRPNAEGRTTELRPAMVKLEQVAATTLPGTPAQLRHYLQQRSYRKAWNFLHARDHLNTAGNCGRHDHLS